jgi:hypothetical protein
VRKPKQEVNGGEAVLGRNFRAYHDERTVRRAPCASDGSLIDERHRTPARTTVCDDEHLVLVALRPACGCLAVGMGNADGAVSCRCPRSARRRRRTFRSLRSGRSWWTSRSRRTRITFFTRRPDRARITLRARRALSTACHTDGKGNRNRETFDLHAHTSGEVAFTKALRASAPPARLGRKWQPLQRPRVEINRFL